MGFFDYTNTTILFSVVAGLVIIAFACLWAKSKYDNGFFVGAGILSGIFALIVLCFSPATMVSDVLNYTKSVYQTALESEYEVFIDGVLTDGTKVDVTKYKMSINKETREIYLTPNN